MVGFKILKSKIFQNSLETHRCVKLFEIWNIIEYYYWFGMFRLSSLVELAPWYKICNPGPIINHLLLFFIIASMFYLYFSPPDNPTEWEYFWYWNLNSCMVGNWRLHLCGRCANRCLSVCILFSDSLLILHIFFLQLNMWSGFADCSKLGLLSKQLPALRLTLKWVSATFYGPIYTSLYIFKFM